MIDLASIISETAERTKAISRTEKVIPFPVSWLLPAAADFAWQQLEAAERSGVTGDELTELIYRAYDLKDRAQRLTGLRRRRSAAHRGR